MVVQLWPGDTFNCVSCFFGEKQIRYILIACFLGNISAKNCRNRTVYVKNYSKLKRWDVFLRHGVIRGSQGQLASTSQTASRLVQPFLQRSRSWQTDRPTDRQTDRPRYDSVCNSRPHLCTQYCDVALKNMHARRTSIETNTFLHIATFQNMFLKTFTLQGVYMCVTNNEAEQDTLLPVARALLP